METWAFGADGGDLWGSTSDGGLDASTTGKRRDGRKHRLVLEEFVLRLSCSRGSVVFHEGGVPAGWDAPPDP